jgi:uncharacterized protein (DUF1684 family)
MLLALMILQILFPMTRGDSATDAYEKEIRAWHERRIASLKKDYGWLTLVALDWLHEGPNEVKGIGMIVLHNTTITFEAFPNVEPTRSGQPFRAGILHSDAEKGGPDTVAVGSKAFVVIKRGERYALRMWDKESPRRQQFKGIERFPVSTKWRIEARWEPYTPPKTIRVATVIAGYEQEYPVPGVAIFTIDGKEYRLEPVLEEPHGDYFFIVGDRTNGKETYGGGRYLYASPPGNGKVIIDFNKLYNPPCVFTEFATCPLPPPANRLPIPIHAGEKKYDHR